ncbi:MAG: DinB family protein [Chloroflexota bacterium]|nr:DinB family protein [Chloroflexota bacterium]
MLDYQAVRDEELTITELVTDLKREDLRALTDEMIDTILEMIADCIDVDVTFVPSDPEAHDAYATTPEEADMAWTLGHVIVHITASAEESAALAAELARGVRVHGRSRYEVPWEEMTTIEGCRQRLEESRRMRHASLDMWSDPPHLDNNYKTWSKGPRVNAIGRFALGLMHTDSHLGQIADIVQQAIQHRGMVTR